MTTTSSPILMSVVIAVANPEPGQPALVHFELSRFELSPNVMGATRFLIGRSPTGEVTYRLQPGDELNVQPCEPFLEAPDPAPAPSEVFPGQPNLFRAFGAHQFTIGRINAAIANSPPEEPYSLVSEDLWQTHQSQLDFFNSLADRLEAAGFLSLASQIRRKVHDLNNS